MGDVQIVEETWQRILQKLDAQKLSFDTGAGIFLHDRQTMMENLNTLVKDLRAQIDSDCQRYRDNLEAGKGAMEEL